MAESLAGCCYKASPCASMIKGEKKRGGGGGESKKEKEKKNFKRWQTRYWFGGLVVLFCLAFVFLFAATTLPKISLPPTSHP